MSTNAENLQAALARYLETIAGIRREIAQRPDDAELHFRLGTLLTELVPPTGAQEALERAIALAPHYAPAHHNLGILLSRLYRPGQAQQSFERAIGLEPSVPRYRLNLGETLRQQQRFGEAIVRFDEALGLDPQLHAARCSRGLALLAQGNFHQGWADYEARIGLANYDTLALPQPRWNGESTDNTVLVHAEGGLGDTLQYIRYVRLVRERAPRTIVAVRPELIALLSSSGYGPLVSRAGPLPQFDMQVPLLSLPFVFRTELDSVPRDVPYLAAERAKVEAWRSRLAAITGKKVGIHWQGNPRYWLDRFRSIPLVEFEPLARVPGVALISLQKNGGREQLSQVASRFAVIDLGAELDAGSDAFVDTAAVMKCLDLVITSDTATAHLAGGLGVPVWVALDDQAEWRWLVEREDSPWYPTMRLFRQSRAGDWGGVFARMARELTPLTSA